MKFRIGLCASLALLFATASAAAAPKGTETADRTAATDAKRLLGALDADGNGMVSRSELWRAVRAHVSKRCAERFADIDRDGDGRVHPHEVPRMDALRFARYDADGDGSFTVVELQRHMVGRAWLQLPKLFARLDRDRDGGCCVEELAQHRRGLDEKKVTRVAREPGKRTSF